MLRNTVKILIHKPAKWHILIFPTEWWFVGQYYLAWLVGHPDHDMIRYEDTHWEVVEEMSNKYYSWYCKATDEVDNITIDGLSVEFLQDTETYHFGGHYGSVCYVPHSFHASCGAGAPLFPLVHLLPHLFPFFTFLFLSLALPIFFFCPSLPFLPE